MKVTGTVVQYPHKPLIEYNYEGQLYNFQAATTSKPPSSKIGEPVEVFINPKKPQDALIDTFLESYMVITIFGGLGFLFFLVGSGVFFLMKKL